MNLAPHSSRTVTSTRPTHSLPMSRSLIVSRLLEDDLPAIPRRRAVFAAVVECWNDGLPKDLARALVARRFDVTQVFVREVEAEGVENGWSPLGER